MCPLSTKAKIFRKNYHRDKNFFAMTPETYQKIDGILEEALGRESSAREAFIAKACGADQDLLEHVQALLAAHGQAGAFLSDTALETAARTMVLESSA